MNTHRKLGVIEELLGWAGAAALTFATLLFFAAAGEVRAQAAPEPASEERTVKEALEDDEFHYVAEGRRDPFRSLMILVSKKKPEKDLPPIQKFELSEIKIAGVILDDDGPRAMIKAPDGTTYVVKGPAGDQPGTIIGRNEGEVIEVTMEGIRVVEKFLDFSGNETLKEVLIKARPDIKEGSSQ